MSADATLYGLLAEFDTPEALVAAARQARAAGYRQVEGYTPYPVEELYDALELHRTPVPLIVLLGGTLGAATGYGLQYWVSAVAYPLNVGGRPDNSWPMFVPVTFELMVLFAALFALVGLLWLNGLPQPYHPVFNVPRFDLASRNRFFLLIEATDPKFNRDDVTLFLRGTRAREVTDVQP
jgi:hypothetical protein